MKYLFSDLVNVDVWEDDGWIISSTIPLVLVCWSHLRASHRDSQLQCHSLQRLAGALDHELAGGRRPGEANLVDAGVAREPRAQPVVAAQRLHNTRREELLRQLDKLEAAVGSEWSSSRICQHRKLLAEGC